MKGFLFDENLPSRLRFSPRLPIVAFSEIGTNPTDSQIWEFARQRELVIVSKDADFSERIITRTPPPWVVIAVLAISGGTNFMHFWPRSGRKSKRCSRTTNL